MNRRKQFLLILGGICIAGMLLRTAACMEMYGLDSVQKPAQVTDMATYYRIAREIVQLGQWPEFFDYQPFYYTIFLPLCFLLSPSGAVWPVLLAQVLLAGGAIWLTGICGEKLAGRRAGCIAAAILMLSRMHIFYTPFMLLELLQSFWMILILFLSLWAMKQNRWFHWGILGLVCGFSALTRGNALLLMPGCLALAGWCNRRKWQKGLLFCLLLCCCFQLPQLPYSWRNYRAKGRWCGPSVAQDKVLALGNTPEAPAGGLEYPLSYHQWCALADQPDPEKRISVPSQILSWLRTDPLTWLELKWRMFLLFWDAREIPNNVSMEQEGRGITTLHLPFLLDFSIIGTVALMGIGFCLLRRKPEDWYLFYMILMYCGSTVAFYILARFRLGSVPLLAVAGGIAGAGLWRRIQEFRRTRDPQQRKQLLLPAVLFLLIGFFMVNMAYSRYQIICSPGFMRVLRPYGTVADFPEEVLIYDYAPAGDGGWNLQIPEKNFRVEKTFAVKPELAKKICSGCELRVRLFLSAPVSGISGTVSHGDRQYEMHLEPGENARTKWLVSSIPEVQIDSENRAVFSIALENFGSETAVGFEMFRNYGRTKIAVGDGHMEVLSCEFLAQLRWRAADDGQ